MGGFCTFWYHIKWGFRRDGTVQLFGTKEQKFLYWQRENRTSSESWPDGTGHPLLFITPFSCFLMSFSCFLGFFLERYCDPGRLGTQEFFPGFLLLPLSQDKGTARQGIIFAPWISSVYTTLYNNGCGMKNSRNCFVMNKNTHLDFFLPIAHK